MELIKKFFYKVNDIKQTTDDYVSSVVQTVEKVQFLLGFFCVLWYNKVGDKNDSKRQNT